MSTPDSAPRWLSLRGLAAAIGVDAGQLSKESNRPGFPRHDSGGGVVYDPAEVLRWRQTNVRRKKPSPAILEPSPDYERGQVPPGRGPSSPAVAMLDPNLDAELLAVLQSGKATALEITRATMQIAARRVARAHHLDVLGPNDLDGLKKSLQELRTAEAGYIDLEKSRRELIPRGDVRLIVAELCGRLVQVLGVLENSIVTEFSVWLADPMIAAMSADERSRLVRDFVMKSTRSARNDEANAIEELIDRHREE
jgi:hypothetical protein